MNLCNSFSGRFDCHFLPNFSWNYQAFAVFCRRGDLQVDYSPLLFGLPLLEDGAHVPMTAQVFPAWAFPVVLHVCYKFRFMCCNCYIYIWYYTIDMLFFQTITYIYICIIVILSLLILLLSAFVAGYMIHIKTAGAVGHAGGARPGSLAKGASRTRTPFGRRETHGMIGEWLMILWDLVGFYGGLMGSNGI